MSWTVETLNRTVDQELALLPADLQARLVRMFKLIEAHGFQHLPRDTVKHLEGKLWESASGRPMEFPGRSTLLLQASVS